MHHQPSFHPLDPNRSIRRVLEEQARQQFATPRSRPVRPSNPPPGHKRALRWQDRVLLIVSIVLMAMLLLRIETASAQEQEWGMQFAADGAVSTATALDTAMHVEITGLRARVLVVQSFRNDSNGFAEAIYRFPLPDGAAVDQLYVQAGNRVLEGEIQQRELATRVYQQARAEGRTAGLVEQQRNNQFSTSLANIGPGEDIQVMIGFMVNVHYQDGAFSLRLPTTFNRRYGSEQQPGLDGRAPQPLLVSADTTPDHGLDLEIELLTDLGFAAVESRYHDIHIESGPQGYSIRLVAGPHRTDRDFELVWYPDLQETPNSSLLTWNDGDAVYAQLMLVPPAEEWLDALSREVIFVIDTSGSMEGASLGQAKAALLRGLEQLGPGDYFNLVQFNSETELLFPQPVPATPGNQQEAREYIHKLHADGGTEMRAALEAALGTAPNPALVRQVVFITDGSVGNERELLAQIGDQLGAARLFTVAIGSAPNSWFMRKAAEIGRGSFTHIGQLDEVETRISALWSRIQLPAITDICIDWGMPAEYYPEIIPDLYAGSPLWVIARLPGQPGVVSLCGELNGQQWTYSVPARARPGNDSLASLWGRSKIESLQDSLVFGADPMAMQEQVTQVALDFSLLTPYTSLVAVDKTPVRMDYEALDTVRVASLLPAGSSTSTTGFPATATGWKAQLFLSLLVLLVASWLFFSPGSYLPVTAVRSQG